MDTLSKETNLLTLRMESQNQTRHDRVEAKPILDSESTALAARNSSADSNGISLFTLPLEIRQEIYGYVFHDRYIIPSHGWSSDGQYNKAEIGLLGTCKDIHREAIDVAYTTLTFILMCPSGTSESFNPAHRIIDRIQHVELGILSISPGFDEDSQCMKNFLLIMMLKLGARKTTNLTCRVVIYNNWVYESPWGDASLVEAINCAPNLKTLSVETKCWACPKCGFSRRHGHESKKPLCREILLRDYLALRLEETMGTGHVWDSFDYHGVDFHPQSTLSEEHSPETSLEKKMLVEDGSEEGPASEDIQERQESSSVRLADEETEN